MQKVDDVIIHKTFSIKRCLAMVKVEFGDDFRENFSKQDAAMLNILRACEQAIDLANYVVKKLDLGAPNDSRDSFDLLEKSKIIDRNLAEKLKKMIGFRNISVHEYEDLDIEITISVIKNNLSDLVEFCDVILKFSFEEK
jgi:uncharacterized protein YutE (UPF0331/DUF86 family)